MNRPANQPNPNRPSSAARALGTLLLVPLIERIAARSDRAALRELQEQRKPFKLADGVALCFTAFLSALCEAPWAWRGSDRSQAVLDKAYNLTLAKFLEMPRGQRRAKKRRGPDCRCYYRGFLTIVDAWRKDHSKASVLEEEEAAAGLLQRFVLHQFRKSCAEAQRANNPARSRYTWRLPGGNIVVYLPVSIAGRCRREWLETHIDKPDPQRLGERQRVQAIIDQRLGVPRIVSWNDDETAGPAATPSAPATPLLETGFTVKGLAEAVAEEKCDRLHVLRPTIKALGRKKLKRFVRAVFRDLRDGCYEEKRLAERFGLSRSAVTRFAGSRWRTQASAPPPDLWKNTAEFIAADDDLSEAARAAGVWPCVLQAAASTTRTKNRRRRYA